MGGVRLVPVTCGKCQREIGGYWLLDGLLLCDACYRQCRTK